MTAPPDWVAQGIAWRNSLTPATAVSPAEGDTKPRVFNISVSSPADAARQLNRIWNSRKLLDDARQSPVQADATDAPFDLPVRRETDAQSDPNAKENLSEKRTDRPTGTEAPSATTPSAPATVPQTPTPTSTPATSTPPTAPSTPSTSPLQELGILPGGTNPAAEPNYPAIDPKSSVPLVVATALPEGSSIQQASSSAYGIRVTETTASVPGLALITTTKISDAPVIEAVVECTVPVPPAVPGVVPRAITNPETIFRTGSSYSPQQLDEDLRIFDAGRLVWAGPGRPADYDVAQARLTAAMYTPGEQFNDLVWAQHEPRNQAEVEERFAAVQRLNQAGIPWLDPTIKAWVADQQKNPVAESPYSTVDNTRPSMYSPAELRQQTLEANRTALTANDLKQGINDFLVASTVGPAIVLWDAAHDRGDHSGAEITWAAAELGINTASILPGLGTLTGAAAKAGLRRVAPKMWEAMSSADNAVDAARIARAAQERELADTAGNYRQRSASVTEPPRTPDPASAPRPNNPTAPTRRTPDAPGAQILDEAPASPTTGLERPSQSGASTDVGGNLADPPRAEISTAVETRIPETGLHRGGLSGIDEAGWRSVFPNLSGQRLDDAVESARLEVMNRNDISRIQQSARSAGADIDAATLRDIKEYNFNSRGLQFSTENYNAWTRLGNGTATVNDIRYLVHEASELRALRINERETGFDFMGRSWDRMSPAQRQGWNSRFDEAYTASHSDALRDEYKFLTDVIGEVTNGNIRMRPEVAAAIDRRPEAREHMFIGEVPLGRSVEFAEWKEIGSTVVTLTGSGAARLGLQRGTQISQAELLQRVKYLRAGSWR
ncbi:hypothetical protein ACFYO7_10755 [Nocardia salmonicida]|uniref:hypothetical protein n=1 Tax=Nocardia salmonicida TaxID=53431 RepID=UPI0036BC8ED5